MLTLIEIQSLVRDAVVTGETGAVTPWLTGGRDSEKRLVIHRRNYEASLVNALLEKFPATAWLVGTAFLTQAAARFVHTHPPQAPCIAEYGEEFPRFLSESPGADRVPYLGAFARLEWHVGKVAIAVDEPAIEAGRFSAFEMDTLPDIVLTLQRGVRYLQGSWPVDDLMRLYLSQSGPDRFELTPADVWIEVRGSRGEFHINRRGDRSWSSC